MRIDSYAIQLIKALTRPDPFYWDIGEFVEAYQRAFGENCANRSEEWEAAMEAIANIAIVRFGRANWLEAIGAEPSGKAL